MTSTPKIRLTNEKETLFIPLCGKALDFRSKNSILNDRTANEIIGKVDIDLAKYKRTGGKIFAVRAKQYDEWTKRFMAENKNAVVVHLGCGLDARITRVQPPDSVLWLDIDYPEVIDLRKEFYPETERYRMIAGSITAPDWIRTIPAGRPAFIMAEGVFEYLPEEEIKTLLHRLTGHFSHGRIAFDVMNLSARSSGSKKLEKTANSPGILKWAADDLSEVDKLNPTLKRTETVSLISSVFTKELSLGFRLILRLLSLSPKKKNAMRLLLYDF